MAKQKNLPRGIRNNNPGNLRRTSDPWQGLSTEQSDAEFFSFNSSTYGIRALARVLISYQDKYGLDTIDGLISRWAPGAENDTAAYVQAVARRTGFGSLQSLNMHRFAHLKPIVEAIIWHENGMHPYTEAEIVKALVLAGVEPEVQSLQKTRTVKGGQTATAATAGLGALEAVQQTIDPARDALVGIVPYIDAAKWLLLAVTLIGIGVMLWARIDDRRKGIR